MSPDPTFGNHASLTPFPNPFSSDAINTTSSVATLFGRVELKMTSTQLLVVAIIPPIGALIGNYIWLWISRRFHWSSKTAVLVILGCFLLIPIYGLIGYSGVFGIVKPVEVGS